MAEYRPTLLVHGATHFPNSGALLTLSTAATYARLASSAETGRPPACIIEQTSSTTVSLRLWPPAEPRKPRCNGDRRLFLPRHLGPVSTMQGAM